MELRQLEHFIAVAEELSFTRAARRLHVVQSGVSAAIRSLERELGCALFERTSQRVQLTGAGAALLPEARSTLRAAQTARDAVREAQDAVLGTVNVGSMASVEVVDLPGLLGQLHATHRGIDVRLRLATTGSAGLAQSLLTGDLDVAFLSLPERRPAGIDARRLATVPLFPVVPADHPLAKRDDVTLAELANEPFVDFPPGYGNREVVDRAFAAAGLDRRVALEVPDITVGASLVRHGLGVAFLPVFAVPQTAELRMLSVRGPALRWSIHLGTPSARRPSAAVRALVALVDAHVRAL
ncbi:LysR family transcriptional regulator [Peterkaempfera sp. SMS 1(5)a]|uniref:LysR family transcriptional regulator n=1 Tax=Peterkaempfera podocarpi TaxID=3232308 RepID=UPI00366CD36A